MKTQENYMEGAGFLGNMKKKVEKTFKKSKNKNTTKQNFNPREAVGNFRKLKNTTKSNISKGNLRGSNIYYNATNITSRRADAYSKNKKKIIKREECKVEHNSLKNIITNITNKNGIFRNGKQLASSNHLIFPYCNEHTVGGTVGSIFNKVNRPKIERALLESLQDPYNVSFIRQDDISVNDSHYESPPSNVTNFITHIKNYIRQVEKNVFIVSHGSFLQDLIKTIVDKDSIIDNLDIVHLVFELNGTDISIKAVFVSRFQESYKVKNSPKMKTSDTYHVFLMRHCIACHNLDRSVSGKYYKFKHLRAGKYALCTKITVSELKSEGENIQEYVKSFVGDLNNMEFGSSVIFRAIFTALLLKQHVFSTHSSNTIKTQKLQLNQNMNTPVVKAIPVEGVVKGVVETGKQHNNVYTATQYNSNNPNNPNPFLNTRGLITASPVFGGFKKVKKKKPIKKKVIVKKKVPVKITKCMVECRKCITKCTKLCNSNKNKLKMKECVKKCKCCINLCKTMIELCKCDPSGEMCKKMAKLCAMCCKKCMVECNKHKDDKLCKQVSLSCKTCHTACMKCC